MLRLLKRVKVWHFIAALATMLGVGYGAGEYDMPVEAPGPTEDEICVSWCAVVTAHEHRIPDELKRSFVLGRKCVCSWYSDSGYREYVLPAMGEGR